MHRALLVQEIVRDIMSSVDSPGTALAFALSSRMLVEAGLEALWRHGGAWELAMTMPERFYKIETIKNGGHLLVGISWFSSKQCRLIELFRHLRINPDLLGGWGLASFSTRAPCAHCPSNA